MSEIEKLNKIIDELREQKAELQDILKVSEKNYVGKNIELEKQLALRTEELSNCFKTLKAVSNEDSMYRLQSLIEINTEIREHLNLVSGESIIGTIKRMQCEYDWLKKNADNMKELLLSIEEKWNVIEPQLMELIKI